MDLNDTPEQAEYRAQVRSWIEEHRDEAPILRGEGAIEDEDEAIRAHRTWQVRPLTGPLRRPPVRSERAILRLHARRRV